MNPRAKFRFKHVQSSRDKLPIVSRSGPSMNPVKHGLRSDVILLPGDDAAEFQALRADLYETYRPLTGEEARCVERMAGFHWRMARCVRWEGVYDAKCDALLYDADGAAAQRSEPDTHYWEHRATDCGIRERRMDRALTGTERRLLTLQKLRRNGLLPGAVKIERDYRALLAQQAEAQQVEVQPPPEAQAVEARQTRAQQAEPRQAQAPAPVAAQQEVPAAPAPVPAPASAPVGTVQPDKKGGLPSLDGENRIRDERTQRVANALQPAPKPAAQPSPERPRYPIGMDVIPPFSLGGAPFHTSVSSAAMG